MKCCLFQLFSLAGRICSRGFIILTDFDFATCLYTVWTHCCFMHTFLLIFCGFYSRPAGFDLWCDWAFSLTSFETYSALFFFIEAEQPFNRGSRFLMASHAGAFKGALLSSLTTNACSTENNIPFPNLTNHILLSKLWKLVLDHWVIHYEPQGRFSCTHQGSLISMEIPTNWTQVTTRR